MATTIEGQLIPPADLRIGIVVARFNDAITERLLDGALDGLRRYGVPEDAVTIARVPGSFEIPLAAKELASGQRLDAIICLGCVIRGETRHFELVADGCAAGVRQVSLECRIPLIFAVLTVENAGDRPVQVGSHFHFFEVNRALVFDRQAAYGMRLDLPAGTAVRFEPGDIKTVQLVALGGSRQVYGGSALVMGTLDDPGVRQQSLQRMQQRKFGNV